MQKNAILKLENIHNFDTYFHPLRNIVLKLFDDKCKAKVCEIFKRQLCPSEGQNVTLLTMIF